MQITVYPPNRQAAFQTEDSLSTPTTGSAPGFLDALKSKVQEVDHFQHQAEEAMTESAVKGADRIHESMIKLEEADISTRLLVKVRNKALDAYQEIMRMQF